MRGVIACGSEPTAQAGAAILERGGNAADAAVAACFATATGEPTLTSLAGAGILIYRCAATGEVTVCDFVVFGIAPAALIYFRLLATNQYAGWGEIALTIAAGLYVVALAVRLARFNIAAGHKGLFFGIPGTLMGAIVAASYLSWDKYALSPKILVYGPVLLLVGALLMVSSIRIPKLAVRKSMALNVFQFGNVIAAYILAPLMLLPEYLLALALLYSVGGIGWCLIHPEAPEPHPPQAEADEDDEAPEQAAC